jgi:hypothetical protein
MTAPLFSFLNDKGNKSYNSILQVRKELSQPNRVFTNIHTKPAPRHFTKKQVVKANKAAVWASSKNRIDFNTVGLPRPVLAVKVDTLHVQKVEEIAEIITPVLGRNGSVKFNKRKVVYLDKNVPVFGTGILQVV